MKINFAATQSILKLAYPILASQIITTLGSFLCMIFVAQISIAALTASALIMALQSIVIFFCVNLLFAIGITFSKQNQDAQTINKTLLNGFLLGFVLALISIWVLTHAKLILFGQDPLLIPLVQDYFSTFAFSLIPGYGLSVLNQFQIGTQNTRGMIFFNILQSCCALILSYLLIFGKCGLPNLGIGGAGLANSIAISLIFLLRYYYLFPNNILKKINFAALKKASDITTFLALIKLGLPIALQNSFEIFCSFVITILIGLTTPDALAALQIASQFVLLYIFIPNSISQAATILISQAYSNAQKILIAQIIKSALIIICMLTLLVAYIYITQANTLVAIYLKFSKHSTSLAILNYAKVLFTFYAAIAILDSLRLVLSACLRGLHNTIVPMKVSFMSYVIIIIPFAYLSGVVLNFGIKGIMSSFLLGLMISVIALSYYLKFLFNQKISLI